MMAKYARIEAGKLIEIGTVADTLTTTGHLVTIIPVGTIEISPEEFDAVLAENALVVAEIIARGSV